MKNLLAFAAGAIALVGIARVAKHYGTAYLIGYADADRRLRLERRRRKEYSTQQIGQMLGRAVAVQPASRRGYPS